MEHRPERLTEETKWRGLLDELLDAERWSRHAAPPQPDADIRDEPGVVSFYVRTVTRQGLHEVVSVTSGRHGAEPDGVPAVLSEVEQATLRSVVRALLDLMGHASGPALTEIALTPEGPRIVACRR